MSKSLKILVVRFSSIGDIVLTTPVLRILKNQLNAEVHYLTKKEYSSILKNNPNINKLYSIESSILELRYPLQKEKYDYVIDLHNNLRSSLLISLGFKVKRYVKSNFKKFLFRNFGINLLKNKHVVVNLVMKLILKVILYLRIPIDFLIKLTIFKHIKK